MPQQSTAVSQWPTAERHVSFTKARKSRKWPWPSEAMQVVRGRGRHSWEVRPALRVRQSPAHTVPGRLAVEHPRLAHEKDRRGRQAGPKSPIPLSSPSPRHPWDCPNLPAPSRVAGRTQHSSPTGTSVRIPREWFPQQQPPHGRFQNFRLLLAAPRRAQGRRTSASY